MANPNLNKSESTRKEPEVSREWATLQILNVYRVFLALILFFIWVADISAIRSQLPHTHWYGMCTGIYILLGLLSIFCTYRRWPDVRTQAVIDVFVDIFILTLLMAISGGGSVYGLGILVNAAIAGGSILVVGRIPLFFAAIASISVLTMHALSQPDSIFSPSGYIQIGILGATFFATAILAYGLSKRVRDSEALARQRGYDLAKLEKLNEMIIQRMRSGVIVLDEYDRVRLINKSAWYLLGIPIRTGAHFIGDLSGPLMQQLRYWQKTTGQTGRSLQVSLSGQGVLAEFTRLEMAEQSERFATLIFLEDSARMAQQVQQMKLASLGRLTASIAHEIRNPLGAISHAGQLLAESQQLKTEDIRLTKIIQLQCTRMNDIIENVLQLSRRKEAAPQMIRVKPYLEELRQQLEHQYGGKAFIHLKIEPENLELFIDKSQLHQVLTNLCENGLLFSKQKTGKYLLDVHAGVMADTHQPYLDVIDFGEGVPTEIVDYIFEPFFTTKNAGTGLGLYIARELCEANQASLLYYPIETGGSCFRIIFSTGASNFGDGGT